MRTCLLAMSIGFCAAVALTWSGCAIGQGDGKITVRPLKFAPKDPAIAFTIGGQSKLTRLADAEAVENLVGKASARALIDLVDFKKEAIVFVSWTTSGPPDGMLTHDVKKGILTFYVQGPKGAKIRGERARIGADFFAVPQNVQATFDPKER